MLGKKLGLGKPLIETTHELFEAHNAITPRGSQSASSPLFKSPTARLAPVNYGSLNGNGNGKVRATDYGTATASCSASSYIQQSIAVFFAVFLNLLDACTFGVILFPAGLGEYSSVGVSAFLLSTFVSQAIFTTMSGSRSSLGTSMAENIPFVNTMATGVMSFTTGGVPIEQASVMPTILVTIALSTMLNGVAFYLVGRFRVGNLLHHFPRHIIVGIVGGFGIYLFECAFEISTTIPFVWEWSTFAAYAAPAVRWHWIAIFILQAVMRLVSWRFPKNEMIMPLFMLAIPVAFYLLLLLSGTSIAQAQAADWLFRCCLTAL